jgi:hypothetical protein
VFRLHAGVDAERSEPSNIGVGDQLGVLDPAVCRSERVECIEHVRVGVIADGVNTGVQPGPGRAAEEGDKLLRWNDEDAPRVRLARHAGILVETERRAGTQRPVRDDLVPADGEQLGYALPGI